MLMRSYIAFACLSMTLFSAGQAFAVKPITYPGGTTAMAMTDGTGQQLHLLYTFSPQLSAGLRTGYNTDDDYASALAEGNILLKRWNNPDSQGNLFLNMGLGAAYSDDNVYDSETEEAAMLGLQADWEDRRVFVSYEPQYFHAGHFDSAFHQSARIGVAPYVAEYGELHTWLMLQVDHHPEGDDKASVTPLVRLFKGDMLGEAGISDDGDVLFNLVRNF